MRRRFRRGFHRRKVPTQWVVDPAGYGEFVCAGAAPGTTVGDLCVTGPTLFALVGTLAAPTSDPPSILRFTVNRIVGQIVFGFAPQVANPGTFLDGGVAILRMGIISDDSGTLTNPMLLTDGDDSWLWMNTEVLTIQRTATLGVGGPYQPVPVVPLVVKLDIKVKRVLRPSEQLHLVIAVNTFPFPVVGNAFFSVWAKPFLRTLISRSA